LTVLDPCVVPKFAPLIVISIPIDPMVWERLVMVGVGFTVKFTPLLASPNAVTTTGPVVAPPGTGALI
jgi:hypothetical protein